MLANSDGSGALSEPIIGAIGLWSHWCFNTSAVWSLSHRGHLVGWSRIESGADHTQIGWSRNESGADYTQRPTGDARTSLKCRAQSNAVALVLTAILKSNAS